MFVNVKIESETLAEILTKRVEYWTEDAEVVEMFGKMYESYCESGCFDGCDFDVMAIVDNDYVNYCDVISKGDEKFEELLKIYKEQGLGDCSCESEYVSYIEVVDDEEEPTMFLVRY